MNKRLVTLFLSSIAVMAVACGGAEFSAMPETEQSDSGNDAGNESTPEAGQDANVEPTADVVHEPNPEAEAAAPEADVAIDEAGEDAAEDTAIQPEAGEDATEDTAIQPEAGEDAAEEAEVQAEAGEDVVEPVEAGHDAIEELPPVSPTCSQYGQAGKIMVYAGAGIGPSKSLAVYGSVNFPSGNDAGTNDIGWWDNGGGWCWSPMGDGHVACFPKQANNEPAPAIKGTVIKLQPGLADGLNLDPTVWLCDANGCNVAPFGVTVCAGLYEVCTVSNGVPTGTASIVPGMGGRRDIRCEIPF